jgi:hypothetical protein
MAIDADTVLTRVLAAVRPRLASARARLALALALVLASAGPVDGYKQLIPPESKPQGTCTGSPESPCIRWRKTSENLSVTIDLFLDSSLTNQEVNLATDVRNAKDAFNSLPARNPYIVVTADSSLDEITAKAVDLDNHKLAAETVYQPNFLTDASSTNLIDHAKIKFNTEIEWRRQLGAGCYVQGPYEIEVCWADARKVANHEMGHVQGLAHEWSPVIAVMRTGGVDYYALQPDDVAGIQHIYGAYP